MSLKIRTMMQGDKTADEHIQDFEKAALEARYEGCPLIVNSNDRYILHFKSDYRKFALNL